MKYWLQPQLPTGNYSIKRIIDIDPNNVWINYGQEKIGAIAVSEDTTSYAINLKKTGEALKTSQEPVPTGTLVKEAEAKDADDDNISSLISMMKQMTGMMIMLFIVVAGLFIYIVIDRKR